MPGLRMPFAHFPPLTALMTAPRVFLSVRFAEAMDEAVTVKGALEARGVPTFLCDVPEGDDLGHAISLNLVQCELVVIFGTETYGEKTQSVLSTFEELRFVLDKKRPFFVIKMCSEYKDPFTQIQLTNSVAYFPWEKGTSMPKDLPDRIVKKLNGAVSVSATPAPRRTTTTAAHGIRLNPVNPEETNPGKPDIRAVQMQTKRADASPVFREVEPVRGRKGLLLFALGAAVLAIIVATSVAVALTRESKGGCKESNLIFLYAVGGEDGSEGSSVDEFDGAGWTSAPAMATTRYAAGVGVLNHSLYSVGGWDGGAVTSSVEMSNEAGWISAPAMATARYGHGVAVLNGFLYAVGGVTGGVHQALGAFLSSVEKYDGISWTSAPAMSRKRQYLGVGVLNGTLYAVGGWCPGTDDAYSSSVEKYDGISWTSAPAMATPRYGHGVAVLNGLLYAVGGNDGSDGSFLSSVEKFDGTSWTSAPALATRRSNHGVAALNCFLYAMGGTSEEHEILSSVEKFDGTRWASAPAMARRREYFGVAAYFT
jgi:hypothetical protein